MPSCRTLQACPSLNHGSGDAHLQVHPLKPSPVVSPSNPVGNSPSDPRTSLARSTAHSSFSAMPRLSQRSLESGCCCNARS